MLLTAAAALLLLLLLPPGTGAAVSRLRVSANFVSTREKGGGGARWEAGGAALTPPSLCLQECRATGE